MEFGLIVQLLAAVAYILVSLGLILSLRTLSSRKTKHQEPPSTGADDDKEHSSQTDGETVAMKRPPTIATDMEGFSPYSPPSEGSEHSWSDPRLVPAVVKWNAYREKNPAPKLDKVWNSGAHRTVMFTTNRSASYETGLDYFSGERSDEVTFGHATVRIPDEHTIGAEIRVPKVRNILGFKLKERPDPAKHFSVVSFTIDAPISWATRNTECEEALLYVHGFNTGFTAGLLQTAQIAYDLQTSAMPVLFSWPSRGTIEDYVYDISSALNSAGAFIECLNTLMRSSGIKRVHILAHSMGNLLVLNALSKMNHARLVYPISELMMAAPDVDWNLFKTLLKEAAPSTTGRTLYASSADWALAAAKRLAGNVPRAGDVPNTGAMVMGGLDTIDVTAVGAELFGFNHSTHSRSASVLNDIGVLLSSNPRKPAPRLAQIRGVPKDARPPQYWRYEV